ncbi:MAG: glycosyltransferase family 2 protein [Clostridia bacterium]|nr:glycosyltransferase family 2 protein [Clostridia bacterium]
MNSILILLAAYNGSAYLAGQLDSILAQDCDDWHLIVSDDGSDDGTQDILAAYAAAHPGKITCCASPKPFSNACDHFLHLLCAHHDADYVMFCDQDDVWHRDKISHTLAKMQETEGSSRLPSLVFTDMRVVDEALEEIHPSFLSHSDLKADRCTLRHLLMQNVASGNTVMINAALARLIVSSRPASGILMHDWWFALVAAAMGNIGYVPRATADYRQHSANSVGAVGGRSLAYIRKRASVQVIKTAVFSASAQAEALLHAYGKLLSPENAEIIRACAAIKDSGWTERRRLYLHYGLFKSGLMRLIAQFLFA